MPKKQTNSKNSLKKDIEQLYKVMCNNDLYEVTLEEKAGSKIRLRRAGGQETYYAAAPAAPKAKQKDKENPAIDTRDCIVSPMNGIFYSAPSPGAEDFVKAGSSVTSGDTLCIIEAMKLMNEVQVERNCKIKKVLVKNATSVKVNQPLFEVE